MLNPSKYVFQVSQLSLTEPSYVLTGLEAWGNDWLNMPANADHEWRGRVIDALNTAVIILELRDPYANDVWRKNTTAWVKGCQARLASYFPQRDSAMDHFKTFHG